ncbi:MAG: ribosome silencing factor [Propionibacteriaceae bacterium]
MPATTQAIKLTREAAEAAASKKGSDLVAFDVSEQLGITDVFLIVSATNERQVGAVVDAVEERLLGRSTKPLRREGGRENRWVLLDYGDVVIHVQHTDERHLYALERLWRDCPRISLDGIVTRVDAEDEDGTVEGLLAGERMGR